MFLIDAIKPNVEKEIINLFYFYATAYGRLQNKNSFVSFRVWFAGGKKKFYSKETRNRIINFPCFAKILCETYHPRIKFL